MITKNKVEGEMDNKIIAHIENNRVEDLHSRKKDESQGVPIYSFSKDGEDILRHSAAHILGEVLLNRYKNICNISFATGPTTENGFYYDVLMDSRVSSHDLLSLEEDMKALIKQRNRFIKRNITWQEANEMFENDVCKQLILQNIRDNGEVISIYQQGHFIDLCKGPHVENTGDIGLNFVLTRVSQVQWHNLLLQRIEGKLFYSKERLQEHLQLMEKQERIDHRKIGGEMELFKQLPVSQGNVFWLTNGASIFHFITKYLQEKYTKYNYNIVKTPLLFGSQMWKDTGHWDKYFDNMYVAQDECVVKPMNCPGHVEIFKLNNLTYKDLPHRIGEICHVHRKEETGALNGLKRAMGFHQDDGHIFCTLAQIDNEITLFYKMLEEVYGDFGFKKYSVILSTRPEKSIGSDEMWEKAEDIFLNWLNNNHIKYVINKGDGAFYGPKLEVQLEDNLCRHWTCGTFQLDFFLPERLKGEYITNNNTKAFPVMCHRAILGSIERFLAILIEHYEGHLPLWIMPITGVVMCISQKTAAYSEEVYHHLKSVGMRVQLDISDNTMNSKLKTHLLLRVPYIIIVGEKELMNKNVTIRHKNINTTMKLEDFIAKMENIYTPESIKTIA